jgi:hypothetical protein
MYVTRAAIGQNRALLDMAADASFHGRARLTAAQSAMHQAAVAGDTLDGSAPMELMMNAVIARAFGKLRGCVTRFAGRAFDTRP